MAVAEHAFRIAALDDPGHGYCVPIEPSVSTNCSTMQMCRVSPAQLSSALAALSTSPRMPCLPLLLLLLCVGSLLGQQELRLCSDEETLQTQNKLQACSHSTATSVYQTIQDITSVKSISDKLCSHHNWYCLC